MTLIRMAKEGKCELKYEPDFNRLDIRGGWETGGHWEVDGGQDHHAGDVDAVDQAVLVLPGNVLDGGHDEDVVIGPTKRTG